MSDKIREVFSQSLYRCPVGIELEIEFESMKKHFQGESWSHPFKVVTDGSLRMNGYEVVTKPFSMSKTPEVCESIIEKLWEYGQPVASPRCGLHVHVNVQEYTTEQFHNLVCNFLAIEEYLIPESRKGLLFCVSGRHQGDPLGEFKNAADSIVNGLNVREPLHVCTALSSSVSVLENTLKYSATNIACTPKLGSVEFRFMEATLNPEEISAWAIGLVKICETLKDIPAEFFVGQCLQTGSLTQFKKVVPEELKAFINTDVECLNDFRYLRTLLQNQDVWRDSWFSIIQPKDSRRDRKRPHFYYGEDTIEFS